ncbi:MAG: pilus assembly protein PilO [Chlorogloeopsis fritschii C42_A2020_084]|uniref:pilus assembly protein PilO n=1 Tax=Chlorogloeopsis fritschii TaxID=1124 RepID=UPI0019EB4CCA|nr:pilus assembly protein PilO [Chlorogloeopsis fritschii]MBF2009335.1 pilus assembly protein PilO [Chlorogloeopsis fritschii C42_A2020_084]
MTLSEDLNFIEAGELEDGASGSPVIFGITLTPKIIGIVVGVLGIAGALFMVLNLAMPAWESFQQQQAKQTTLQTEVEQKKSTIKQMGKVKQEQAEAKQQQIQVLALFANEKTLDTLLIDLNRLIEAGNGKLPFDAVRAKLRKFTPAANKSEPITDNSLGAGVNGKLKRTSISIDIIGTYEQTQSILRNIERLQPLLIVKEYQSSLAPEPTPEKDKVVRRIGPAPISTSFQLQALMPLNPEEIAAAAKAAAKK